MSNIPANPPFAYRAFISYNHADKTWADWLHKALETYRVPSRLVGRKTTIGVIPRRLAPIFRDRDELASAHDLGSKVNAALAQSEALVVICSPRSAQSRWVNQEVLAFKRLDRQERIFCLIVDGEPDVGDLTDRDAEECFCPALRHTLDEHGQPTRERAEPIAADARPSKDGKANAKLKLLAGLLDVGFDVLKQREQHRRVRRMAVITTLALMVTAITSVLAVYALISRHEAVIAKHEALVSQQAAERRQQQAEGLVGFMLGDLYDKLAQVNRLDIMQAIDDKAMTYFQSLPTTDITATSSAERAKALEKIGTTRMDLGHLQAALESFDASTQISSRLAAAAPANIARRLAYSRTLTFVGMVHWDQGDLGKAQQDFESSRNILRSSPAKAKDDLPLLFQVGQLDDDIGHVLEARGRPQAAETEYREMLALSSKLVAARPDNTDYASSLGMAHNNLGKLALQRGDLATAVTEYRADDAIETRLAAADPRDNDQRANTMRVRAILGRTLALTGDNHSGMQDLQQAVNMAAGLCKADPNDTNCQEHLALYASQLARLRRANRDLPAARALTARSIGIFSGLTQKDPSNMGWQSEYAEALTEQAAEFSTAGQPDRARAQVQTALEVLSPLLAKQPQERALVLATISATLLLAEVTHDPQISASLWSSALGIIDAQSAGRQDPRLLALKVAALLGLGRKGETEGAIARLRACGYRDSAFVDEMLRANIKYSARPVVKQRFGSLAITKRSDGALRH